MKAPLPMTDPRLLGSVPLGHRVGLRFCRQLAPAPRPSPLAASRPQVSPSGGTAPSAERRSVSGFARCQPTEPFPDRRSGGSACVCGDRLRPALPPRSAAVRSADFQSADLWRLGNAATDSGCGADRGSAGPNARGRASQSRISNPERVRTVGRLPLTPASLPSSAPPAGGRRHSTLETCATVASPLDGNSGILRARPRSPCFRMGDDRRGRRVSLV